MYLINICRPLNREEVRVANGTIRECVAGDEVSRCRAASRVAACDGPAGAAAAGRARATPANLFLVRRTKKKHPQICQIDLAHADQPTRSLGNYDGLLVPTILDRGTLRLNYTGGDYCPGCVGAGASRCLGACAVGQPAQRRRERLGGTRLTASKSSGKRRSC